MSLIRDIAATLSVTFGIGPKGSRATLSASGLTTNRTHTLPDKSGTFAMLDDVGGTSGWTPVVAAQTIVAGAWYIADVTTQFDLTLPAFVTGDAFVIANKFTSVADVRVVVGGSNAIDHPDFATGDNVLIPPGAKLELVASSTTILDIV